MSTVPTASREFTIATGIPNCREGRLHPIGVITPDWMREVAVRAEELGFDSLWLNEFADTEASVRTSFPDPPRYYDPLLVIADLAARTSAIRFLTATLVLPEHSPLLLARQALTLSSLTGGRLSVGVGLGGSKEEFRRLHGELTEPNRGQMMEDYLAALRVLWSGQPADYAGTYARFQGVQVTPLPGSDRIPLLLAGAAAGAMDRLARYADGWIDSHHSPDEIRQIAGSLSAAIKAAGRCVPTVVFRQFNMSLAGSAEAAEAQVAASLRGSSGSRGSSAGIDRRLIGTPETVGTRLREYIAAGVNEVCAIFFGPDLPAVHDQMELFTREVVPMLREPFEQDSDVPAGSPR
jgi:probable F420-dependent oxidoreductase